MLKIDACGLSCPEPVIMLKKGMKESQQILLLVDNKTSVETCSRFADSKGYKVDVSENQGVYHLTITKE